MPGTARSEATALVPAASARPALGGRNFAGVTVSADAWAATRQLVLLSTGIWQVREPADPPQWPSLQLHAQP